MGDLESSRREAPESRDTLVGEIYAPFELREATQRITPYAPVFMENLNKNWGQVCELMNWKTDGQVMDISIFKLAKDPVSVVRTIQEAIVTRGGKLEKYGQDGKFGPETVAALAALSTPKDTPVQREEYRSSTEVDKMAGTQAGLNQARSFREALGKQDSLLAKLSSYTDELLRVLEAELKKRSVELKTLESELELEMKAETSSDLLRSRYDALMSSIKDSVQTQMATSRAQMEAQLTPSEKADLVELSSFDPDRATPDQLAKIERPLAFHYSAVEEALGMSLDYFKFGEDMLESMLDIFPLSELNPFSRAVPGVEVSPHQENPEYVLRDLTWQEAVAHGPYLEKGEPMFFTHVLPTGESVNVKLHLDGTIELKDRLSKFKAGEFDKITKFEATPSRTLYVTGEKAGKKVGFMADAADLATFLNAVAGGSTTENYELNGLPLSTSR